MDYIKTKIISALIIAAVFFTVLFTVILNKKHERYILFFKNSFNSEIEAEIRYLPKQNIKPEEAAFMEELALGPVNHDLYSFINPKFKLISCFSKEGILHVNFPENMLENIKEGFDSDDIAMLLQKNIFTNLKHINEAVIYIEGKEIYKLSKK